MRRILISLLLLLLLAAACATTAPTLAPGTAIHYVKSNLDGSKPSLVTMYVVSADEIEVSKSEKGLSDSADIRAHIDWARLTADHLDAGVLTADGERQKRAELRIRGSELAVTLGEASDTLTVNTFPLHVYNFDLMSLNVVLPRLEAPDFRVAFVEPTFGQKPGVMELRGFAEFAYDGNDTIRGVETRRYRVGGPGLAGQQGTLWVNANDGYIERFESRLPNNPGWNSLRLERRGVTLMTPEQWRDYKIKNVGVGVL